MHFKCVKAVYMNRKSKTKRGDLRKCLGVCRRSPPNTWSVFDTEDTYLHIYIYHSKLLDCQECQSEFLWNRQSSIHYSVCAVADGNLTEGCISARAVSALSVPNTLLETPGLKAQLSSDALCVSWWIFIFISLFFRSHWVSRSSLR